MAMSTWLLEFGGQLGRALTGRHPRELALQGVEVADDDGQQVVEIVRDAAGELADGLHLLRLAQRFLGRAVTLYLGFEFVRPPTQALDEMARRAFEKDRQTGSQEQAQGDERKKHGLQHRGLVPPRAQQSLLGADETFDRVADGGAEIEDTIRADDLDGLIFLPALDKLNGALERACQRQKLRLHRCEALALVRIVRHCRLQLIEQGSQGIGELVEVAKVLLVGREQKPALADDGLQDLPVQLAGL